MLKMKTEIKSLMKVCFIEFLKMERTRGEYMAFRFKGVLGAIQGLKWGRELEQYKQAMWNISA